MRSIINSLSILLIFGMTALAANPASAYLPGDLVPLPSRPIAPPLKLPDVGGELYNLEEMRGKVVIINFWATWCAPCRAEMPSFQRLLDRFPTEDLTMLAVNVGDSKKSIARFFFRLYPQPTYTILTTRGKAVFEQWQIQVLPTTYIVDKNGRVSHMTNGAHPWDTKEIMSLIKKLIDA